MVKVKLRETLLKDGRVSLYLDYYPPIVNPKTGKSTRREFLKLYYNKKTKDPFEKQKNQIIKLAAEKIRVERENKLLTGAFEEGSFFAQKESFLDFFKTECKKRATSDGNYNNWKSSFKYFSEFTHNRCLFKDLNEKLCIDFKEYLENTTTLKSEMHKLSDNSKHMYFNKFKAAVKEAYLQGLISKNFVARIQSPKAQSSQREYFTPNELAILRNTPCENETIKRVALFCATTGLRIGDAINLTWRNYFSEADSSDKILHFIRFEIEKTKTKVVHPISNQAFEYMGEMSDLDKKVFLGFKYSSHNNLLLERWIRSAGIDKPNCKWHSFRHSYALKIIRENGIYAGKEMLHHQHIKTTEIYSHMLLEDKIKMANSIEI